MVAATLRRALACSALLLGGACTADAPPLEPTAAEQTPQLPDHAAKRRPPTWAMPAVPACAAPTPLLVHHDAAGRVDRLHARLEARGIEGPYLVDTGSLRSFATHSAMNEPETATTIISCATTSLPIIARQRPGATPDGERQVGVLGADLVAHGWVLDLDLRNGTLRWGEPVRAHPAGAVVLPIEWRNGWLVASRIVLDGRPVKLVVDTGSTNVIWVNATPRAGETREDTVDGTASPIVLWHGEGSLTLGNDEPRRVPVDRTDQFPTLEALVHQLGDDVAGLLGITALGRERVIIGRNELVVVPTATPE